MVSNLKHDMQRSKRINHLGKRWASQAQRQPTKCLTYLSSKAKNSLLVTPNSC